MKLCLAFAVRSIRVAIYNVYFHPLSKFPGPILATATSIPYAYHVFNGRGVDWLQYLHEKYGKVVRVRPNELSYADPAAWHDIFLRRPLLPKPSFKLIDTPGLIQNMNEVESHTEHSRLRKILAPGFSDRALREQEYIVQKYINHLVKRFQEAVMDTGNGSADIELLQWCQFTTFDIIGDLFLGESFRSLENSEHHLWVKAIFNGVKISTQLCAARYFSPLDHLVRFLLPKAVRRMAADHYNWSREKVELRVNQGSGRQDMMSYILRENSDEDKAVTREALDSNSALIILAGSETVAITVASTTWFLLKNPLTFKRLQQEIRSSFDSAEEITMAATADLPYLRAVILEALRLHPPQPLALPPRVVNRPDAVVCGQLIPIGVRTPLPIISFTSITLVAISIETRKT